MNIQNVVSTILAILEYVLPAAFLWAVTDRAVRAIIKAAVGRSKNGL